MLRGPWRSVDALRNPTTAGPEHLRVWLVRYEDRYPTFFSIFLSYCSAHAPVKLFLDCPL